MDLGCGNLCANDKSLSCLRGPVAVDFVLYLEMHQPLLPRKEPPASVESWWDLTEVDASKAVFERALGSCYLPLLRTLEELAPSGVKVGLRVSGVLLESAEEWGKSLLERMASLISVEAMELVAGPYFNLPPFLFPADELVEQTRLHRAKLRELFGIEARTFAAPYLAYSDEVGRLVRDELNLRAVLAEGAAHVLAWRTPHFVYKHPSRDLTILIRDQETSNQVAFGLGKWLTAAYLAERASRIEGTTVVVAVPAETFGLSVPASAGAFEFLRWLPKELAKHPWIRFALPSDAAEKEPVDVVSVPQPVTWLETKDLRSLTESAAQQLLLALLMELRGRLRSELLAAWRFLAQADLLLASRSMEAALRLAKALCALRALVSG